MRMFILCQGATIQMQEGEKTSVRVARVMHGGAADRAGKDRSPGGKLAGG